MWRPRVPFLVESFSRFSSPSGHRSYITGIQGRLGVVGVPFGKGQKKEGDYLIGLEKAPAVLRSTQFMKDLQLIGVDVEDYGDVCYSPTPHTDATSDANMHNLNHVAPLNHELSLKVRKVLSDQRMCLNLGGDHSLGVGSIAGHVSTAGAEDVAILYVDAHADINLSSTSSSGNIHGMTLALIAKELQQYWATVPGWNWVQPSFHLSNIAYIGLRSVDPWEAYFIEKYNIPVFSMTMIDKFGIHAVLDMAMRRIDPNNKKSIHLSIDTDSMDYAETPATTLPVRGGLTLRESLSLVEEVHKTGRLAVMDLVEFNPCLGDKKQVEHTLDALKHLLLGCFGVQRGGNKPRLEEIKKFESTDNSDSST